jgi:hypothetical protein
VSFFLKQSEKHLPTDKVPDRFYPLAERKSFGGGTTRQRQDAARNLALERDKFNTEQLPLYVVVRPLGDGSFREVARYDEGKINDEMAFLRFLSVPVEKGPATRRSSRPGRACPSRSPQLPARRRVRPGQPATTAGYVNWGWRFMSQVARRTRVRVLRVRRAGHRPETAQGTYGKTLSLLVEA